jgi:Rps23 Pro-64 3,4-dihydroxylase Tpa1-like proline 4-hydroxylase
MSRAEITLNPAVDRHAARAAFAAEGRVHIPAVLEASSAQGVYRAIVENDKWNLVFDLNGQHRDLDAAGMAELGQARFGEFLKIVHGQAERGFQYLFSNFPLYEFYHRNADPAHSFNRVFEFLNSRAFMSFIISVTGCEDIAFADAQVTRYTAGHFLTAHDDAVEGKNRRVAYVLGMTPEWRADWGGQLQFLGDDGHVERAYTPAFNALNLFKVPMKHAVSAVSPFAGAPRYSITGWLRAGEDPEG